jgi:2'-5' RNA ligase
MKSNLASLQEFTKHKDGTYAAYQMSKQSQDMLDHFVEMNLGLTERIDPSTYHITIIYSRTPVASAEQFKGRIEATATCSGYEVFPTKTGDKCLVMRMDCPSATTMNEHLAKLGATSDYDSYKPHVTICYNYNGPEDVSVLPRPQFPMHFDELEVKPLDPEFIPANK